MKVIYTESDQRKPGALHRPAKTFFGVIAGATSVVVDGDYPNIVEAYRKAGIKVAGAHADGESDPLKMKVPELKEWLTEQGIEFDASAKKEELQALVPKE